MALFQWHASSTQIATNITSIHYKLFAPFYCRCSDNVSSSYVTHAQIVQENNVLLVFFACFKILLEHMSRTVVFSSVFTQHPGKYSKTLVGLAVFSQYWYIYIYRLQYKYSIPCSGVDRSWGFEEVEAGKDVSVTHRLPLSPSKYSRYLFLLEAESAPKS